MVRVPEAPLGGVTPTVSPFSPAPLGQQSAPANLEAAAGGLIGRSIQGAGASLEEVSGSLLGIATKMQIEQNEREAKELDTRLAAEYRDLLYGTEEQPGLFRLNGQAALDARPTTIAAMEKARQRLLETASNDRVKQMFGDAANSRFDQEAPGIERHTIREHDRANKITHEARLKEFNDTALAAQDDPEKVALQLKLAQEETASFWLDQGLEPEAIQSAVQETTTTFHRNQIDLYLARNDVTTASKYYGKFESQIDGSVRAKILEDIGRAATKAISTDTRRIKATIATLNNGFIPDDLEETQALLANIPAGLNTQVDNLRAALDEAIVDQQAVSEFNQLTLDEQAATLGAFRPGDAVSLTDARQHEKFAKAHANTLRLISQGEGLQAAAAAGIIEPPPALDFNDPESLQERVDLAEVASAWTGAWVNPLGESGVDQLVAMLENAATPEGTSLEELNVIMDNYHSVLGDENASFVVQEIAKKNKSELVVALQMARDDPEAFRLIVQGGRILRDNPDLMPPKADVSDLMNTEADNLFTQGTAEARGSIIAATNAIYAAKAAQQNLTTFERALWAEAFQQATGGVVEHNGYKNIVAYPGQTEEEFLSVLDNLTDDDLRAMSPDGTLPRALDGSEFHASQLRSGGFLGFGGGDAHLRTFSMNGEYQIELEGVGFMLNANGQPFILDMNALRERKPTIAPFDFEANLRDISRAFQQLETPELTPGSPDRAGQRVLTSGPAFRGDLTEVEGPTDDDAVTFIEWAEGSSAKVYADTEGHPTIGIGFNLDKPGAKELIESVGANYDAVLAGRQTLTDEQIFDLFQHDLVTAREDAAAIIPDFENLDPARQIVFTDMAFNLGRAGLAGFKKMLAAIERKDWEEAAAEAQDSQWFEQVARRGPRNVQVILTGRM